MSFQTLIEHDKLTDIHAHAVEICTDEGIRNLRLAGVFQLAEFDTPFIRAHMDQAKEWQLKETPSSLHINHGTYIHRGGKDGIDRMIEMLANSYTRNRAFVSLVDMQDIVESEDDKPIPSLLTICAGINQNESHRLYLTVTFRALEVTKFLRINLAEVALVVMRIVRKRPDITEVALIMDAFRAYSKPSFHCLRRSEIDAASPVAIAMAVENLERHEIIRWLDTKNVSDSVIETIGIHTLAEAIRFSKKGYPDRIPAKLDQILGKLNELQEVRGFTSHSPRIKVLEVEVQTLISEVSKMFMEMG